MIRNIIGVIVGYAVFGLSSLALFKFTGQDPNGTANLNFKIFAALFGASFSILSGLILQVFAKSKNLNVNFILAIILAGFATISLIKSEGSHWSQWMAIVIFAPLSILGGWFYNLKFRNK